MMNKLVVALGFCAAVATAQEGKPAVERLKSKLNLTDAQVTQLREMRRMQRESLKPIRDQMREKTRALRETMRSDNPDPARAGQLMVDLKTLRKQVASGRSDRAKALRSVLTPEQQEMLKQRRTDRAPRAKPSTRRLWRMMI